MEIAKTRTWQVLTVMKILAWVAFVGLSIETGALIINYIGSWFNAEFSSNLYKGRDLSGVREFSFFQYTWAVSFLVALSGMKAFLASLVIKTLSKVNLMNPFRKVVAITIERISYVLMGVWFIGLMQHAHNRWLMKRIEVNLSSDVMTGEFIFAAGLVFIIAQIFKRGIELQSENELTV